VSNLRAIGIFLYFPDELPNCAGQPRPAYVRNIVSGHFVAFIDRRKEKPAEAGQILFSVTGLPTRTHALGQKGLELWIIAGEIQAPLGDAFRSDTARQILACESHFTTAP
jgi:hypothetical protein